MVSTRAIPRRNPASATRTVEGQCVIAFSDLREVKILNDVGTRVWNLIDGKRTVEEIIAEVGNQLQSDGYDQVPADLTGDVETFIDEIASQGMISLGPEES